MIDSPIVNVGFDSIDVRELVRVGPAGMHTSDCVSVTVRFKSGAEETLYVAVPKDEAPFMPMPADFPESQYATKAEALAAFREAKSSYREQCRTVASRVRAELAGAWRRFA
jgi:hypothetical protein